MELKIKHADRGRVRTAAWLGCAVAVLGFASFVRAQAIPENFPKIEDLKNLPANKVSAPAAKTIPAYQDVVDTMRLAETYAEGKKLLPQYQPPAITRGASGVSIFKSVSPSVVLVVVGNFKTKDISVAGLGAGVIVNPSGDILTNWHVINGHSDALIFLKPEGSAQIAGQDAYLANVAAQDEVSDLALLRLVKAPANLSSIAIGTMASVQVAEDIHVIGHPKGHLWSYSTGVISQIRDGYDWTYEDGSKHKAKVLQLQTAINPGNSGGPVVDDQGKLLGLIAMGEEGQNLDYAIATDVIQTFLSGKTIMSMRGAARATSPGAEYFTARLADGRNLLKVVYPDLTEYIVSDSNGKTQGFIAEASDGNQATAWQPNSYSGFSQWRVASQAGLVRIRGGGRVPNSFSSN